MLFFPKIRTGYCPIWKWGLDPSDRTKYCRFLWSKGSKGAKTMLTNRLAFMVASDAHSIQQRGFYLKEAYQEIEKTFE